MDARSLTVCSLNLAPDALSLIKSILHLRSDAWAWTDVPDLAQWWLVDADAPVETRTVVRSLDKTVLALVSDVPHVPAPGWTFVAKPARSHIVMRVLDQYLGAHGAAAEPDAEWRDCSIRLLRPPDVAKLGATPTLLHWCGEMLRRPVPYVQLVAMLPTAQLRKLLDDAGRDGCIDTIRHPAPAPISPTPEATRSGLWSRLWS